MKKIAVVTGSARGIGHATALALGKAGYHVIFSDVRAAEEVPNLVPEAEAPGTDVFPQPAKIAVIIRTARSNARIFFMVFLLVFCFFCIQHLQYNAAARCFTIQPAAKWFAVRTFYSVLNS